MNKLISPKVASIASHTMAPADGFGIRGVLEANCGCAEAYIMDLGGLLDSIKTIFCVQALVCTFWFGLQQLLDSFLTRE